METGAHPAKATEVQNGKENGLKGDQQSIVKTVASTQTAAADPGAELNGNREERGREWNGGRDDREKTSNGCRKNGVARAPNGSSHTANTNSGTAPTGGKIWRPRSYQTWLEQMSPRRLSTIREREDAACRCSCSQRVQELLVKVERLEAAVLEREDVITSLKADNKRKGSELLEVQQQKLQVCLRLLLSCCYQIAHL